MGRVSVNSTFLAQPQCHPLLSLDNVTYTKLVQLSAKSGSSIHGKLAHAHMIKTSFKPCIFLVSNLVSMYSKNGDMRSARQLFDRMPKRSLICYNLLISGYTEMGSYDKAIDVFSEARRAWLKLDKYTYSGLLGVCVQTQDLELGKVIHGMIIVSGLALAWNAFLTNVLIDMYCKCGKVDQGRLLFECSGELDNASWNSLISGYVRIGAYEQVLKLLVKMHQSGLNFNTYTLGNVLKACCTNPYDLIGYGKMLHGYTIKLGLDLDVVVGTALIDMYAKTGSFDDAIRFFRMVPNKNVIMYNAIIAGCIHTETTSDEFANEAYELFSHMQKQGIKPTHFTYSSITKICSLAEAFKYGKQIHAQICKNNLQSDECIGSALIELYSLMGSIEDGVKCFNSTPKLDIVSWTSMIAGYAQNGQFKSAWTLLYQLLESGRKPDEFIISTLLGACADLAARKSGEQVQGYATKTGIGNFISVQNSQIGMYAKSGDMDSATMTFEETKNPDVVSWAVMICSNAQHGCTKVALKLFDLMNGYGIAPNHITFLGVLTACSYGGLVEEGLDYFKSMKEDYGITPNVKHCVSVVDLLSRAGRLVDAEYFILNSGFENNPAMWSALLSACRVYKDTAIAKRVEERVIELEALQPSSYVLLRNIYTDAGIELPATKIRELMKDRGVKKVPGLSWVEVDAQISPH